MMTAQTSTTPLVSIIIPTYQRPALLLRAVRSALAQSFSQIEVLVIVDGPDNATEEVSATINDPRFRLISLPRRVGGSETRNTGVREAAGKWVAFLDDDDEWLERKIESQLALGKTADCEHFLVSCRVLAKTPRADYEWPRRLPSLHEPLSEYLLTRDSLFRGERSIQTSTFFAKRQLFERCPFRKGQLKHQDTDWLLRAAQLSEFRVLFVNEILVRHFLEESRRTVSSQSNWRYSFNWAQENRHLFTARAYAGFLVNNVAPEAADAKSLSAIPRIAIELVRYGKTRFREFCVFLAMWVIPRTTRRRLRDFISRFKPVLLRLQ
jgi:glycosyltransferase involved in cell wall biosynthesis